MKLFWNQRGKRPGSCAVYIEPWHKDIFDVLDMRKKTGDENLRARDLFSLTLGDIYESS
jgi:ribonucleotide reductase alpha subunit